MTSAQQTEINEMKAKQKERREQLRAQQEVVMENVIHNQEEMIDVLAVCGSEYMQHHPYTLV